MSTTLIHRFGAVGGETPVNAYIIESRSGTVAIDSTLTVSDGRALRGRIDELGKPLLGVVVTHTHPDHYGGLVEVVGDRKIPVFAAAGIADAIRKDDPVKEQILRPMFGDEWAHERSFPNQEVGDDQTLSLGDIELRLSNLGPGESPHDSFWTLESDRNQVFCGDLAYDRHHCYLADGFYTGWLANIQRARQEMPQGTTLHPGHGEPCGTEVLDWQAGYIKAFIDAVSAADWSDPDAARRSVVDRMTEYLPSKSLEFLMELSIDPIAKQLGLSK
jgi:glyoxylase-like metal-dependent hydrolase (beta-lactamase superfamily II)